MKCSIKNTNYQHGIILLIFIFFHQSYLFSQSYLPIYKSGEVIREISLIIGGDDGEGQFILNSPTQICISSDNRMFILDREEKHVLVFNDRGQLVFKFGREGQGPVEFNMPRYMAMDDEDNIVVYDLLNRRFDIFNDDGLFKKSVNHTQVFDILEMVHGFRISKDNRVYVETTRLLNRIPGESQFKLHQMTTEFKQKKIVLSKTIRNKSAFSQSDRLEHILAYQPKIYWDVTPSGNIIIGYSEDYKIEIYSPDLKLIKEMKHEIKPQKITADDKESYFNSMAIGTPTGQVQYKVDDRIRKRTKFPKYKPYFVNLKIDHEGFILIQTFEKAEDERVLYDVFTPTGEFVNRVKIPPFWNKIVFNQGKVYEIITSQDTYPIVIVYKFS